MWLSADDRSEIVGAVFLDFFFFFKSFDLVDHTILQQKLMVYLNNPSVVSFFHSFLSLVSDRSQYVCVNGKLSAGAIKTGVPQGSILGSLLFCIFIHVTDLPLHVHDKKVRNSLLMIHLLTQEGNTKGN